MNKLFFPTLFLLAASTAIHAQGTFNFATTIGGTGQENLGESFTYDGNPFVYGSFYSNTIDINPRGTAFTLTNLGNEDGLVVKYDTAGQRLLSIHIGGNMNQRVNDVLVDPSGIYVCGFYQDTVDFDPTPATVNLIGSSTQFNSFIAKYNHGGGLTWVKGISNWSQANAMCITTSGNLAVVGIFSGTIDADPGPGTALHTTNGGHDCFYAELNPTNGNYIQSTAWGGSYIDHANDVVKMNGTVAIAGCFSDTCDFDPGIGVNEIVSTGSLNGFVLNLSSTLQLNWVHTTGANYTEFKNIAEYPSSTQVVAASDSYLTHLDMGGNVLWSHDLGPTCYFQSLLFNAAGNIVAGGILGGPFDFDPGAGFSYVFGVNGFWSEFSSGGTLQYIKTIPGYAGISGMGYTTDGRFHVTGLMMDSVDFNPASGVDMHYSASPNVYDMFIAQFDACTPGVVTYVSNLCAGDTMILDGLHYVSTEFSPGFPQLVCIELNQAYFTTETFSWLEDGEDVCDTVRIVTLTGMPAYQSSQAFTICGGDSVVVGSNVYTATGTYIDILSSSTGCDSTVTTNLTVNTVDTSLTVSWSTMMANATGATYQWIDCSTGNPIAGETGQYFTATQDGEYACIVTQNACTDTSGCYNMVDVGINELAPGNIVVFPNPANNVLNIRSAQMINAVRIVDGSGRTVLSSTVNGNSATLDTSTLAGGLYLLEIITPAGPLQQVFTKE